MNTIERLKQLEAVATPRPWYRPLGSLDTVYHDEAGCTLFISNLGTDPTCKSSDAELIVEMRNALPKLLAFVAAWDACLKVTENQAEKVSVLLAARAALEEEEEV